MKLVSSSQMRSIDATAIEKFGVPSLELMENAGKAVAEIVKERFPKKGLVGVVCGRGNNAGDGLVAARYLAAASYKVIIILTSPFGEFSKDARVNWERLAGIKNIEAFEIETEKDVRAAEKYLKPAVCLVDAIFGTGLSNEVRGRLAAVIKSINSMMKPVVAVDVPSGINSDTGAVMGVAVRAKMTVTFGLAKAGLVTGSGPEYAREIVVADIGLPEELIDSLKTGLELIEPRMFVEYFKPRRRDSHKNDFGHVAVVAGSLGKIGAGLLACRGALRSGAGLVTYALPEKAYTKFDVRSPEVMYQPCNDTLLGTFSLKSAQAVLHMLADKKCAVIGPGIGGDEETKKFVIELVKRAQVPLVLDADALNDLTSSLDLLRSRKAATVLTPHPGEMARLTGHSGKDVQLGRILQAKEFATSCRVWLVLKGHRTVVASPEGEVFINPTGNPGMSTAGSGDVLSGVVAGFIAQGLPIREAVIAAVYLHGLSGDMAARNMGERGLIASDLINMLPLAMKSSFEVATHR